MDRERVPTIAKHLAYFIPYPCSSWNRTPSLGYRIINLQLAEDGRTITDHSVFADG